MVLEDDYDAEYRYDRQPIGALQGLAPELVTYAGTVSKTLAPGLRLGWVVAPPELAAAIGAAKAADDLGTPVVEQLGAGRLPRARRARPPPAPHARVYRAAPRHAGRGARRACCPDCRPAAWRRACTWWCTCPSGSTRRRWWPRAHERGVGLQGVAGHRMAPGPPALLLGYGRIAEPAIERGVRALADSLRP